MSAFVRSHRNKLRPKDYPGRDSRGSRNRWLDKLTCRVLFFVPKKRKSKCFVPSLLGRIPDLGRGDYTGITVMMVVVRNNITSSICGGPYHTSPGEGPWTERGWPNKREREREAVQSLAEPVCRLQPIVPSVNSPLYGIQQQASVHESDPACYHDCRCGSIDSASGWASCTSVHCGACMECMEYCLPARLNPKRLIHCILSLVRIFPSRLFLLFFFFFPLSSSRVSSSFKLPSLLRRSLILDDFYRLATHFWTLYARLILSKKHTLTHSLTHQNATLVPTALI